MTGLEDFFPFLVPFVLFYLFPLSAVVVTQSPIVSDKPPSSVHPSPPPLIGCEKENGVLWENQVHSKGVRVCKRGEGVEVGAGRGVGCFEDSRQ